MTKILTETYTLPACWASYLINGDATGMEDGEQEGVDSWLEAHPWLGECLSVENDEEFAWDNDADDIAGSVADFTFPVTVYEVVPYACPAEGSYKRLVYPAEIKLDPLPFHEKGLSYTATGYGKKIPTTRVLHMFGRKYRIYCSVFSNIGTCYIIYKGEKVIVD